MVVEIILTVLSFALGGHNTLPNETSARGYIVPTQQGSPEARSPATRAQPEKQPPGQGRPLAQQSCFVIVSRIVSEHLGVELDKVKETSYIVDDLGADSVDAVELVMALEEVFGIEIPDNEPGSLKTVGDIDSYLARQKQCMKTN